MSSTSHGGCCIVKCGRCGPFLATDVAAYGVVSTACCPEPSLLFYLSTSVDLLHCFGVDTRMALGLWRRGQRTLGRHAFIGVAVLGRSLVVVLPFSLGTENLVPVNVENKGVVVQLSSFLGVSVPEVMTGLGWIRSWPRRRSFIDGPETGPGVQ